MASGCFSAEAGLTTTAVASETTVGESSAPNVLSSDRGGESHANTSPPTPELTMLGLSVEFGVMTIVDDDELLMLLVLFARLS